MKCEEEDPGTTLNGDVPQESQTNTKHSNDDANKSKKNPLQSVSAKIAIFCAMTTFVFWVLSAQIFGIFTNEAGNVKKARVVVADFDGGIFGQAVVGVMTKFNRTDGFPTFVKADPQTSTIESVYQDIFVGKYWSAFIVHAGSTDRFFAAVNGSSSVYSPNQTVDLVTFEARNFQLFAENILQNLEVASITATIAISEAVVPQVLQSRMAVADTQASRSAIAVPVIVSQLSAGFHGFNMDNKPLINTVGTVFLTLMGIFPCIASHHIVTYAHIFQHQSLFHHLRYRFTLSLLWPLFASLSSAGFTFAFRGDYPLTAKMFFAYWAVSWVYVIITFDIVYGFLCFAPMALVPLFAVSWVIFSISATLGSPDILNNWYRIDYFFPSLHWWQTVITILTKGGVNRLDYTLPTLAGWLFVGKIIVFFGVKHQLKLARSSATSSKAHLAHRGKQQ